VAALVIFDSDIAVRAGDSFSLFTGKRTTGQGPGMSGNISGVHNQVPDWVIKTK
jgi:hypothetical protein